MLVLRWRKCSAWFRAGSQPEDVWIGFKLEPPILSVPLDKSEGLVEDKKPSLCVSIAIPAETQAILNLLYIGTIFSTLPLPMSTT